MSYYNENVTSTHSFTLDELHGWSKKQLQEWLSKKGLAISGNKDVLSNRVYQCVNFVESDVSDTSTSSSDDDDSEFNLPNIANLTDWEQLSSENCPSIREDDVQNYFLFEKNPVTGQTKNCNRQLKKSRKFFDADYISNIMYNNVSPLSLFCAIRSNCRPSMRSTVKLQDGTVITHYTPTALITKQTAKIVQANCDCKAGLSGVCSHVGGMLLSLVSVNSACTSKLNTWLCPRKPVGPISPKRLQDINFCFSENSVEKPYPNVHQGGQCKDPEKFYSEILEGLAQACPDSVLYKTMCATSGNIQNILNMYKPNYMFSDKTNLLSYEHAFEEYKQNLKMSKYMIEQINDNTRGQVNNRNWKEIRTFLITASNFGTVYHRKPQTSPNNLLKHLRNYTEVPDVQPILHGRKYENIARREYVKFHKTKCNGDIFVKSMGVCISEEFPFLGASVDGLIECSACGDGALEIKCPYGTKTDPWRNMHPIECGQSKEFCCEISNGELKLKQNHKYFYQVMGQMGVLKLVWAEFVIWTKKGLSVEKIFFDARKWEDMTEKLSEFHIKHFVPEIFTERVKRGQCLN